MSSAEPMERREAWALPAAWFVLVAISAPILVDYLRHVATNSWAFYALVFPPLTFVAVRASAFGRGHIGAAFGLVLVGISIETIALTTGAMRVGRIGFVLCVAALLVLQGRLRARVALLLLLCVPIPHALMKAGSEPILPQLAEVLATLWRVSGVPVLVFGAEIEHPGGLFELESIDLGWTAAVLGFGLAWFVCMRRRIAPLVAVGVSIGAGACGAALHGVATLAILYFANVADPFVLRLIRDGIVDLALCGFALARLIRSVPATPTASAP